MGKYRAFIILGAAIVIALITSMLVYNYLRQDSRAKAGAMQPVVVALTDIPIGTAIGQEMIRTVAFSRESITQGYFVAPATPVGRVVISPIKANEPVSESRLAPSSIQSGGIAAAISANKRAMAVKVDKIVGVSGFIHPNNRVDVLVTINKQQDTSQAITKIVLQNILVLAVGPEIQNKDAKEKPSQVDVITLEVTPEEGEKLALAATEGKLQLALRNPSDSNGVLTAGTTVPALLSGREMAASTTTTKPLATRAYAKKRASGSKMASKASKNQSKSNAEVLEPDDQYHQTVTIVRGKETEKMVFEKGGTY